jgi:hypothetical protein
MSLGDIIQIADEFYMVVNIGVKRIQVIEWSILITFSLLLTQKPIISTRCMMPLNFQFTSLLYSGP